MRAQRFFKTAVLTVSALGLSGCVAAAIPLVAGGALARTAVDGIDADAPARSGESAAQTAPQDTAIAETPAAREPDKAAAARAQLLQLARGNMEGNMEGNIDGGVESGPQSETLAGSTMGPQGAGRVADLDTARPDNAPFAGDPATPRSPSALAPLVRYAKSRAVQNAQPSLSSSNRPLSATLSNPAALDGARSRCEAREPSVLIDLDKAGERFSPEAKFAASRSAVDDLASLREADIAITWISGASAAYAGDVRAKLKASGLDPEGEDQILLMRYPGDRKQTRRQELASATCLLAIAGDERADFDELFEYLARPEAAAGLDLLIGNGWFLLPGFPQTDFQTRDIVSKDANTP